MEYWLFKEYGNVDVLLCFFCNVLFLKEEVEFFFFFGFEELFIDVKDISREIRRDFVLVRVLNYMLFGWLNYVISDELKLYFMWRYELLVD